MKKNILIKPLVALFALAMAITVNAQDVFKLEHFDELVASGKVEVILQKGEQAQAVVETNGLEESDININIHEGVLKINMVKSLIRDDEEITVYLTYQQLNRIKAQAGAEITAKNTIETNRLILKVVSGAEMALTVATGDLDVVVSEGGQLELEGTTNSLDARASSGGMLEAFDLESNYTYITSNTGGVAEVVANKKIEAKANTGGQIEYKGKPEIKEFSNFLSGNIKRA